MASVVGFGGRSVAQPFGSHLPHRWLRGLEHRRSGLREREHQCEPLRGERRDGHGGFGRFDAQGRFVRHRDHPGQALHRQWGQSQHRCGQCHLRFGDVAGEQRHSGGGLQCQRRNSRSRCVHRPGGPGYGRFIFKPVRGAQVHRIAGVSGQGTAPGCGCGEAHRHQSGPAVEPDLGGQWSGAGLDPEPGVFGGGAIEAVGSDLPHRGRRGLEHRRRRVWQRGGGDFAQSGQRGHRGRDDGIGDLSG